MGSICRLGGSTQLWNVWIGCWFFLLIILWEDKKSPRLFRGWVAVCFSCKCHTKNPSRNLISFFENGNITTHETFDKGISRTRMDQIGLANWALLFSLFVRFSAHWKSMHDVKLPKFPPFCGVCMCLAVLSQIDSKNKKNRTKMICAQLCICVDRTCLRLQNRMSSGETVWMRRASSLAARQQRCNRYLGPMLLWCQSSSSPSTCLDFARGSSINFLVVNED